MSENADYLRLIKRAQQCDRDSLSRLAQEARRRVFVYIYRITLDHHLAQDLAQDTMLEMLKSLKRLRIERVDSFWTWLFRTALGKVQHHFRYQGNRRIEQSINFDGGALLEHVSEDRRSALDELLRKELSQAMLKSMGQIKLKYRNILAMRCFEQMSYTQIATITGGTELQSRLLLFRAKRSLKKQLARNGFKKESLLTALGLFGAITASSTKSASAATAISSAATKVGLTAATLGTVTTKSGAAVATATVVLAITFAGPTIIKSLDSPGNAGTPKSELEYSTSLIRVYDPDGRGLKGTLDDSGKGPLFPISPDALVGYRKDSKDSPLVIIPDGYSLEIGFAGTIVNGPGNDIEYIARNTGNYLMVFLTDGAGQEHQLQTISGIETVNLYQVIRYDISDVNIPFEPIALRLEGKGSSGPWDGAAIFNIMARVSRTPLTEP